MFDLVLKFTSDVLPDTTLCTRRFRFVAAMYTSSQKFEVFIPSHAMVFLCLYSFLHRGYTSKTSNIQATEIM